MSEMVDRVADAIYKSVNRFPDWVSTHEMARAAIAALREPTEEMWKAHAAAEELGVSHWHNMIDAALVGGTEECYHEAARIEALEGALRGIRDRYVIQDNAEKCAAEMDAIARAALKERDK